MSSRFFSESSLNRNNPMSFSVIIPTLELSSVRSILLILFFSNMEMILSREVFESAVMGFWQIESNSDS